MTNKGVAIKYGDVAPGAKENFEARSNNNKYDTLHQLQQYNLEFPNYGNPCEKYSVLLDGNAIAFPSVPNASNIGLISKQISNENGAFPENIVLELGSVGQYSSQGLTFTFDTQNQIYPTQLNIKWYRITESGRETLANVDYTPTSAFYFCQQQVSNYNYIVITVSAINMPKNRLRIRSIDYGYGTYFYGDELRNVSINQSVDPISSEIKINTVDFVLDSKRNMEYSFQAKQPLSIYFNGSIRATTFVKKSTRKSKNIWEIQSEDYIGLMDTAIFPGDMYTNKNAYELLEEIFSYSNVPYKINPLLQNETVTGYLPYGSAREALMQVAFAVQNAVVTNDRDYVEVIEISPIIEQTVPLNRIMQGQNFEDAEITTSVELMSHTYVPTQETVKVSVGDLSDIGKTVTVKFNEPLHSLDVVNGTIIESTANYAVVNVIGNCVLTGLKYNQKKQLHKKQREDVNVNAAENIVTIENATLISVKNVNAVLDKCFDWFARTKTTNLEIVEGKHVEYGGVIKYGQKLYGTFKYGETVASNVVYDKAINLGETIAAETAYLGTVSGIVTSQKYNLGGNIIVKEVKLR